MVGGGIRKDDGAVRISNTNVFAALETLKKKKKSLDPKDRKGLAKKQGSSKIQEKESEPPQVTWVPTLLKKSWADIDDDDDDYFKSVPVLPVWGSAQAQDVKDVIARSVEEDSESEDDDALIEDDYDEEDEPEQEPEPSVPVEPVSENLATAPLALKDPEKQLSKKELKKKELEELDALLAEFKMSNKEEERTDTLQNNAAADEDGKENASSHANIKNSKRKKLKKEKSSNEGKVAQISTNVSDGTVIPELKEDPVSSEVDVKEKLKKIALKKKKSTKDADAPSKAAAIEAAARSAKLAAAKKKEKSHYNQQPVR